MRNDLVFPLYHIRKYTKLYDDEGITYIQLPEGTFLLDNKNLRGNSLGERRLRLEPSLAENQKIYPLKKIFYTISDIILHDDKHKLYIDSIGTLFTYTKRNRVPLIYRPVNQISILTGQLQCRCEGIFRDIIIPYIPTEMPRYLGLLIYYDDYIFYSLESESKKDTWRLI